MALTLRVRLATDGIPCAAPVLPHGPRGTFRLEDIHAEWESYAGEKFRRQPPTVCTPTNEMECVPEGNNTRSVSRVASGSAIDSRRAVQPGMLQHP
jgi:hypothetical protein